MPGDNGTSTEGERSKEEVAGEAWEALYRFMMEGEGQRRFREACDLSGLAPGALKTLLALEAGKPQPMRELAVAFHCDPSWITSLVDSLEQAGLAERRPSASDRRVKEIVLTDRGVAAQGDLWKLLCQAPESFSTLTMPELLQLRDVLRKLTGSASPPDR